MIWLIGLIVINSIIYFIFKMYVKNKNKKILNFVLNLKNIQQ